MRPSSIHNLRLKRPPTGSRGKGKGPGGPDPGDLGIQPLDVPTQGASLHGQEFNASEKRYSGQHPNSTVVDEIQRGRKSTASTKAKSILYSVKKSSNAYKPLKSVAEDLWLILDDCEV